MADIFLSYATEDRALAKSLVEMLSSRGWSVWWDRKIPLGQSFDQVIEDAIGTARCVIVLWTRASVQSEWVRSEAFEGKRRGILVPVLLDAVDAPLAFRTLNGADLSAWQSGAPHPELDRLIERITEMLAPPGGPTTARRPPDLNERAGIPAKRSWLLEHWLVSVLSILVLAVLAYAAYVILPERQRSADAQPSATGSATSRVGDALPPMALGLTVIQILELGLHIAFVPPGQAAAVGLPPGAVVWRLESGQGQATGLHARDVVIAINGQKFSTADDLRRVLRAIGPGKSRWEIRRDKQTLTLEIDCPTCKLT